MHERAFVMPEDVQQMAVAVLAHRHAEYQGEV